MYKSSRVGSAADATAQAVSPEAARTGRPVVLKFGSRLLTGGTSRLQPDRMLEVARAVSESRLDNVVIVSSGAVAAGFPVLGMSTPPTRVRDRQAAAAVGQGRLMRMWDEAFATVGRDVGQVLLTNDCLTDRKRYNAARGVLRGLLRAGVVPIVNENDAVSVDGIIVGDNDNLAAMTAALVDAELLVLLTDVEGVFDADPEKVEGAQVVPFANSAQELRELCFAKKAVESTGGMDTKLEAAERAGRYGIPTVIASGLSPETVPTLLRGGTTGTHIAPDPSPLPARRHWMAVQKGLTGYLVIDDGALQAIRRHASLLPSGVVGVGGRFRRGDLIAVMDGRGVEQARGIVRFDDREVERIRGLHTLDVREALGVDHGHVVMRPDRIVLAGEAKAS